MIPLLVWKYAVALQQGAVRVEMPVEARVLEVASQGEDFHIWALVDADLPRETRAFQWAGTGHPTPEAGEYVGTVHERGFVWHLFEVPA
jgi:hypothetical protein